MMVTLALTGVVFRTTAPDVGEVMLTIRRPVRPPSCADAECAEIPEIPPEIAHRTRRRASLRFMTADSEDNFEG